MSDQPHSQFLISLTEFLRKACPEQDAYLIFEVLQEQEYPLTLEELAEHVIDEGYPDEDLMDEGDPDDDEDVVDEDIVLEYDEEKHDNARRISRMREGIAELQSLCIPILKDEHGRYRLGKSTVDIIDMMTAVEKEVEDLHGMLNSMHMNFGRQLEAYHDYDDES
jgi:hypothetical protein